MPGNTASMPGKPDAALATAGTPGGASGEPRTLLADGTAERMQPPSPGGIMGGLIAFRPNCPAAPTAPCRRISGAAPVSRWSGCATTGRSMRRWPRPPPTTTAAAPGTYGQLAGQGVRTVVVSGIGSRALEELRYAGMTVYGSASSDRFKGNRCGP